ncbi:IucA/IucC family siderophore biosynthesis protein [Duganella sp. FT3S]|uniref:IucA/IucC family siderophore biosynthesis protein n=1 Tax=Rugamonas fusca TaxID=2758568 RepID=A0A7W2I9J2_9BURK|nr:IucA/IucC family protein [Rugamonas fusca]MBA5608433.1 IucA/IucC family siderophore biosynthesis protein [Rugamonas fusca]
MPHPLTFLPYYPSARQRTLRQFIEAFWNEGCLTGAITQRRGQPALLRLEGLSEDGQPRGYTIAIAGHSGFERLRLCGPVHAEDQPSVEPDIATVASDLLRHLGPPTAATHQFVAELRHTALNHAWSMTAPPQATLEAPYPWQEAQLGDGHLYHPCFRSRMGFSLDDHLRYGPEFARPFTLVWLAIARHASETHTLPGIDYEQFLASQLGEAEYHWLQERVAQQGHAPDNYRLLPVHPWQWEHRVRQHYADWLADGTLLYLGQGQGQWLAQQSIRSLSSLDGGQRCDIKLPLAIANSSADRILSDHHVHNAPRISRWLAGICRDDPYLADGPRLALLTEPAGITVAHGRQLPGAYGMLGAIWRTAPGSLLAPGEQLFPMTALTTRAPEGGLTIAPWLAQHGTERWVHALLAAMVPPLLHLMMAHGVLLECHAQNTLLILRDGLPCRIAVRDLPGGLHYLPAAGAAAQQAGLRAAPAYRDALNASAGFVFNAETEARGYLLEVMFFINLGELAWRLERQHGYAEVRFWHAAACAVLDYQEQFPAMAERQRQFDLLGPTLRIECLATRRLLGGSTQRLRTVRNPLFDALAGAAP